MVETVIIAGARHDPASEAGQEALVRAQAARTPVYCACSSLEPAMYIARITDRLIVKRMPGTGFEHAPECGSFEAPEHLSGLSELQGSAIQEDPEQDMTLLKLDFALSKRAARGAMPEMGAGTATEAVGNPKKLGLTGLLHYLWQEADLTKWVPAMEGKRWWAVVASSLRRAAHGKSAKGFALSEALLIPEAFKLERKEEITARRSHKLESIANRGGKGAALGLLIAEYKSHAPTRLGARFVFKHMSDLSFFADADLTARFERVFKGQLELADMVQGSKVIVMASFEQSKAGYPVLQQIAMMLVDQNWLPFEHTRELVLIERAVEQKRRFVRQLRYNLKPDAVISTLVLNDLSAPVACFVTPPSASGDVITQTQTMVAETDYATWLWGQEPMMPALPQEADVAALLNDEGEH